MAELLSFKHTYEFTTIEEEIDDFLVTDEVKSKYKNSYKTIIELTKCII